MARRTRRERAQKSRGVFIPWMAEQANNQRQATLQKRLRFRQLRNHYNELGSQLVALSPEHLARVQAGDPSEEMDETVADLLDMHATKAALRDLAAELGINWLAHDSDPEEVIRVIGETLDSQHRTGKERATNG